MLTNKIWKSHVNKIFNGKQFLAKVIDREFIDNIQQNLAKNGKRFFQIFKLRCIKTITKL